MDLLQIGYPSCCAGRGHGLAPPGYEGNDSRLPELAEVKKIQGANGFQLFETNNLIQMHVKSGSMQQARQVFENAPIRNDISWNVMILGYAKKQQGALALQLYAQMQQQGRRPSRPTFIAALKACSSLAMLEEATAVGANLLVKVGSLEKGRALHSRVAECGLECDVCVGSSLVDMYAKCGSMDDARQVFDRLPQKDVVFWNALILGYAEKQQGELALHMYERMQQEGVVPDGRTFVAALKASGRLGARDEVGGDFVKARCLEKGRGIHSQVVKSGFELDLFVGNTLVDMYAKCGSMVDARNVFDRLPNRNVVSWTAIIQGYAEKQQGDVALQLYASMQRSGVAPNERTFVGVLKACSSLAALDEGVELDGQYAKARWLEKGKAVHSQVVKIGCEFDVFVGTTLLDMYAKCGSMEDACRVFEMLPHRNVVSWNAMIWGYADRHEGNLALQLYSQMLTEGLVPDDGTFGGALKACGSLAALEDWKEVDRLAVKVVCLEKCRAIHSQVETSGFASLEFVGNALIDVYAKCGSLVDAQHVFDKLPVRDVVSWNALISGYAEKQEGAVALRLYEQMQQEGIVPDGRTFVAVVKACSSQAAMEEGRRVDGKLVKARCLEKGRAIHSQVVDSGFESDLFVGTTLLDMYAKCGSMEDARHVFEMLPHRNVVSWNAMILGYADKEEGELALQLFAQMQLESVVPDDRTFVGALKACANLAALEEGKHVHTKFVKIRCLEMGRSIHCQVGKNGFQSDVFVGTTLVDMYAKCGSMVDARLVFDKLPHRDVVSWNAMILGYAEHGESEEALKLYARMQVQGILANSFTFLGILKACGNTAALHIGKEIHAQILGVGLEATALVATALVDMYGKCGSMDEARQVFDALCTRDVVTWNALIAGYARQGESEIVFDMVKRMQHEGIQPDGFTFLPILTVCSHVGLVDKALHFFNAMSKEYGITPTMQHYACIIDLLGRAGQVSEAARMVEQMPFQPNLVVWRTLLAACRKWNNNIEVGRQAFESAVKLDDQHDAAYTLMSNIYADAHMWEDHARIQAMRNKAWARKKPGQSWWTDCGGTIHTFMVGDTTHPYTQDIYTKLADLSSRIP